MPDFMLNYMHVQLPLWYIGPQICPNFEFWEVSAPTLLTKRPCESELLLHLTLTSIYLCPWWKKLQIWFVNLSLISSVLNSPVQNGRWTIVCVRCRWHPSSSWSLSEWWV